ncbi:MAG: hypothetical protein ABJI69_15710 [Balneola sp.]
MSKGKINEIILDVADAVSHNEDVAEEYLFANDIDVQSYINRGLAELNKPKKMNLSFTKSQTFFRRLVLAARITHECHNEWTFGSVKFQKMVYLCEEASRMNFSTNYSKQVAGPFDNKFMHAVKTGFEKQKWFSVEKVKKGKYTKVEFSPMQNMLAYQQYYERYYQEVKDDIEHLISVFKKWKTDDVELVATLYHCWDESIKEGESTSKEALTEKLYAWHKKKKKFKPEKVSRSIDWMMEVGIYPA